MANTPNLKFNDANGTPQNLLHQNRVGPYVLDKVLGKGQTGLVRQATHYKTNKKVAIKIVNREKLLESVLTKIEREITIMKLIDHPHVLRLYDVYENKKFLYLVLEHVSGGELFDYLVKKSRLEQSEARRFFRQIISALQFCHNHLICHRDLKPENLLLDDKLNIKIADFGMASLQVDGSMLETSCGSPHYACPEVIRGEKYDGRKADVWSCGVILYALSVGALPFDDDNLQILLAKIKRGMFKIPDNVPLPCSLKELIRGMIETDPNKRLTLEQIYRHPWVMAGTPDATCESPEPILKVVATKIIPSQEYIDADVLTNMTTLGCFKDRGRLIESLLDEWHNTEKVIYFLLLDRKQRCQAYKEDFEELLFLKANTPRTGDMPRKRIDATMIFNHSNLQEAKGSPRPIRRPKNSQNIRFVSCNNTPLSSPYTSPIAVNKEATFRKQINDLNNSALNQQSPTANEENVMHAFKNHSISPMSTAQNVKNYINRITNIVLTPKSNKRNQDLTNKLNESPCSVRQQQQLQQQHQASSPKLPGTPNYSNNIESKSWYQRWNMKNTNSPNQPSPNQPSPTQDKEIVSYVVNDRPFNYLKADLISAFINTNDLTHHLLNSCSFRCEYKIRDKIFSKIKFRVEITDTENQYQQNIHPNKHQFKLAFILNQGSKEIFRNLCCHMYRLISKQQYKFPLMSQQQTCMVGTQMNGNQVILQPELHYYHHYNNSKSPQAQFSQMAPQQQPLMSPATSSNGNVIVDVNCSTKLSISSTASTGSNASTASTSSSTPLEIDIQ